MPRPSRQRAPAVLARLRQFAPDLAGTSRATAGHDVVAGVTVAALAVPQGLAYALVAGCPPEMGLLAAALPTTVAALFGSSRFLVTGPTNPIALVVGTAVVAPAIAAGVRDFVPLVLGTGLVAGLILIIFGVAGIGRASRFLSDSVIAGFATGVGCLIALGILPRLVELPKGPRPSLFEPTILPLLASALRALAAADLRVLGLAVATPLAVLAFRRVDRRIPGALIALAVATLAAQQLGWTEGPAALTTVGSVPLTLPRFAVPPLLAPEQVLSPALAIALLATLQSIAAARALTAPGGPALDPDRELVGQGAANVVAAFVGGIPTCGSLSRSGELRASGGRTRLAAAVSGLTMAGLVPLLGSALALVPLPALVGLVVLSGLQLVNPRALRRASGTRADKAILLATLVATLSIDLVQALYAGVFFSLALLVRRAGSLEMVEIVRAGNGRFREIPLDERTGTTPAVLLHLQGDLNFALAAELADRLRQVSDRAPRVLVLRLKRARYLDATVLEALRVAIEALRARGTTVLMCGLTEELAQVLESSEIAEAVGPDALLRAGPRLFEGFEQALGRARRELAPLADAEIFRGDGEAAPPAPIDYEI